MRPSRWEPTIGWAVVFDHDTGLQSTMPIVRTPYDHWGDFAMNVEAFVCLVTPELVEEERREMELENREIRENRKSA
jgi:hypothetical protein